jgi:hypothetical protein
VPLTVREATYANGISGVARTNGVFCQGVPIPQSANVTSTAVLGLTGATAGQFRILATWDGSKAKWIEVCGVVASVSAGGTATVTLTDSGSGNFGGSNLATDGTPIVVSTNGGTCGSGSAICFEVKKANHNGIDRVRIGATAVVASGSSDGFVVAGPDPAAAYPGNVTCSPTSGGTACTTLYKSRNDAASTCLIEKNGPVQAVLKCEGSHVDGAAHAYMKYTARYYFTKGSSAVKVTDELRNADYGTSNTFATAYKGHQGYELRTVPNISGTLNYAIGGAVVSNGTGTVQTGTMTTSDSVYLYQGRTNLLASNCSGANGCIDFTTDDGYVMKKNTSTLASGDSTKYVEGWADISDASGVGVEIGLYQLSAFNPKSLEFNNGTDVRIGIWPRENSKPYYQSWPQHAIHDLFLIYHASALSSLSSEFMKMQHYLVAYPGIAYLNSTGCFPYPFVDPTVESKFYSTSFTSVMPDVSGFALPYFNDLGPGVNHLGLSAVRYWAWGQGSSNNQAEFRWANLLRFLQRGTPGRLAAALHWYRMQAEQSFPRSDGFNWRDKTGEIDAAAATPIATSANSSLAHRDWAVGSSSYGNDSSQHTHWYGMMDAYYLTGDETLHDAIIDGPVDRYGCGSSVCSGSGIGGIWSTRATGVYLMSTARLGQFLADTGDTANASAVLANGTTAYNTLVKPDLCSAGYPADCNPGTLVPAGGSGWSTVGVSRVRGVHWGPNGTDTWCFNASSCANPADYDGMAHMVNSPFQESILLQGISEFRTVKGSGWAEYLPSFDLMYGIAQWSLNEMWGWNGAGLWQSEGWGFYEPLDIPAGTYDTRLQIAPHGGIISATATNPMAITVAPELAPQLNAYIANGYTAVFINRAAGTGCDVMNGTQTATAVSGNQITLNVNGTGCTYVPNTGDLTEATGIVLATTWMNFHTIHQYTGTVADWLPKAQLNLAKLASTQSTIDDFGTFLIANIIDDVNNPGTLSLNRIPITSFVENGAGSYTFHVTVPEGASSYRIKCGVNATTTGARQIVDWLGYDGKTGVFKYSPATYMAWFAANEASGIPSPGTPGTDQAITVSCGLTTGLTAANFMVKAWSAPALQTWHQVTPGGAFTGLNIVGWEKSVYARSLGASVMRANYNELNSEPNRALMAYDFTQNRFNVLALGNLFHNEELGEGGHPFGHWYWDPIRGVFGTSCCGSQSMQAENINATWWYDALGQQGRIKSGTPNGSIPANASGAYDPVFGEYVQEGSDQGNQEGTWVYNPRLNTWTNYLDACAPQGANDASHCDPLLDFMVAPSVAYNEHDHKIYLWGGIHGYRTTQAGSNKVYFWDHANTRWQLITPAADPVHGVPNGTSLAGWACDPIHNVCLTYGGVGGWIGPNDDNYFVSNSTWALDLNVSGGQWVWICDNCLPGSPLTLPFEMLSYDSENNAFVLSRARPGGAFAPQMWWLRYAGTGPLPGNGQTVYTPTSGGINKASTGWGQEPALTANGTAVYAAWTETAPTVLPHTYAKKFTSSWAPVGGNVDTESGVESFAASTAVHSSQQWVSYYHYTGGGNQRIVARYFDGSAWQGGEIGAVNTGNVAQGLSKLVSCGGTLYLAFIERSGGRPNTIHVYVDSWNGSTWSLAGNALNHNPETNPPFTQALSLAVACDGTNPYVAWVEQTQTQSATLPRTQTAPQVYVRHWNGSSWDAVGGSLNQDTTNGWAWDVAMTYMGGQPYVGWTERSTSTAATTGDGVSQVFVKTYNGLSWTPVGAGTLNKNTRTGWAFRPALATDGTNLFLGWTEQSNLGAKPQVYVSKLAGSSWTALGGSLNADSANGSAQAVTLASYSGQPVAAWGEVNYGATRQVYAKRFDGAAWDNLDGGGGGGGTPPTIATTPLPSAPRNLAYAQTLAATGDAPITWSITSGSLPPGLSLDSSTGAITGTATTIVTSTFTVQASNASGTDTHTYTVQVRNPNVPADYSTFQAGVTAIAALGCGNTLTVNSGTYTENVTVPASNCTASNPITVEFNGAIPPSGVRMTPNYLDPTPKIPMLQGNMPGTVLKFTFGDTQSNGWVFKAIAFNCSLNAANQICIDVGTQDWIAFSASMAAPVNATSANLPSNITFDHCILRGSRLGQARVGMELNGQNLRVVDSWLGDLWDVAASDGQAIRSLSGDGPIDIINTYLDGQTETLGVGGTGSIITTPSIAYGPFVSFTTAGSIPGNVTVDQSHLAHGLWLRYDGMNGFTWSPGQLVRMGQVWIAYANNNSQQARTGVYQAQGIGVTGNAFPTNACTTNGCSFTDGTVTWKALCNFSGGETYIGSGIAKNLAECKQCGAWTIKRSFLQHAWEGGGGGGAQGFALTFSHRSNVAPYSVMGPITFKDNIIDDVAGVLQASAFGDDADSNIYPTVRSSLAGPYTITAGNNTLVVDGVTVTLTTGTRTAAQIAEEINAALPHLTVSSVSAPVDNQPYWTKYTLTLSGNVSYAMSYDAAPILASVRNGITRTDVGQSGDNLSVPIWCTWDSNYNGGSGRTICDGIGQNQVEFLYPYGVRISVGPGATISIPTVASSYHDASTNSDYLVIVKGQYFANLPISGSAAGAIGLPSGTTLYCTHPITRKWYGCGVSKGLTFTNNLVTNASTDSNKFALFRSPYLIWPSNIHPLEISHNTFDYQYGTAFLGQGIPNSGAIRNNIALFRSAAQSGEGSYFSDGRQSGLSWIHSYLCAAPLDGTNISTFSWMTNGSVLPDCQPGVASSNVLPGSTPYSAEVLPTGSPLGSTSAVPISTINAPVEKVVFRPGSYKLVTAGTPYLPAGSYNLFGAETATGYPGGSLELGTKFKADVDGQVTKLRYFHPSNCPAETFTGTLWTAAGAQLATGSFPPGIPGTWVEMTLPSAVNITAGATYVVSYHSGSCYAIGMEDLEQPYGKFPLHVVNPGGFYSGSGFPTIGDRMGHAADVVFVATGTIATGTNGTIGSAQAQAGDYTDVGVDISKLSLIRNLQVTYSDRAAIVTWLDSEVSQSIPGVLRLCKNDPDYDPTCTPAGSIAGSDPVTGALADNSDNDDSPKNGLQRYIIVTGLAANTKYYAQLYRGGHYRAFSFTTLPGMTGSTSVPVSRPATASMGSVATMLTSYGATYRRSSGTVTGSTASIGCSAGSTCSGAVTTTLGDPVYLQSRMQNSAGAVLYSYPVSVIIPGAATLFP